MGRGGDGNHNEGNPVFCVICCACIMFLGAPVLTYFGYDQFKTYSALTEESCTLLDASTHQCDCGSSSSSSRSRSRTTCYSQNWKYQAITSKCPGTILKYDESSCSSGGAGEAQYEYDKDFKCFVPDCEDTVWYNTKGEVAAMGGVLLGLGGVGFLMWFCMSGCVVLLFKQPERFPKPLQKLAGKKTPNVPPPGGAAVAMAANATPGVATAVATPGVAVATGAPVATAVAVGAPVAVATATPAVAVANPAVATAYAAPAPVPGAAPAYTAVPAPTPGYAAVPAPNPAMGYAAAPAPTPGAGYAAVPAPTPGYVATPAPDGKV